MVNRILFGYAAEQTKAGQKGCFVELSVVMYLDTDLPHHITRFIKFGRS